MWTKDTGKTPFLSGCPSMCPICREKGEASGRRRPVCPNAPGADADAGPGETRQRRHARRSRLHRGCFTGRQPREADGPGALTFYSKGQGPRGGGGWARHGLSRAAASTTRSTRPLGCFSRWATSQSVLSLPVCKTGLKNPCFSACGETKPTILYIKRAATHQELAFWLWW